MKCPSCGKEVPPDMALCGYCGKPLKKSEETQAPETEMWRGGYCGRSMAHYWMIYLLYAAAVVIACITFKLSVWFYVGFLAVPPLYILGLVFYRKAAYRYRLTTQRFFRRKGILFQNEDEVELVRVDDLDVQRNFLQRILNVGHVTIHTPTDKTHPTLMIVGVSNPMDLKEKIRESVRELRKKSLRFEEI